jgi:hypothetical protein
MRLWEIKILLPDKKEGSLTWEPKPFQLNNA